MGDAYKASFDAYSDISRMVNNVEKGMMANSFSITESIQDLRIQFGGVFILSILIAYVSQPKWLLDEKTKDLNGTRVFLLAAVISTCQVVLMIVYRRKFK